MLPVLVIPVSTDATQRFFVRHSEYCAQRESSLRVLSAIEQRAHPFLPMSPGGQRLFFRRLTCEGKTSSSTAQGYRAKGAQEMEEERESRRLKQKRPRRMRAFNGILNNGHERQDNRGGRPNGRGAELVPIDQIPEARKMLLSVLDAPPAQVHEMSVQLRKGWMGRTPGDVLGALRRLRDARVESRRKHAVWSPEDIEILRAGYARGLAGARPARKELLSRHPQWNRRVLDYKAADLKITRHRTPIVLWTQKQHGQLMLWSEEITARQLAARVQHSEYAVRARLSLNGMRGKVRAAESYSVRQTAALLGVSHVTVWQWVRAGLLGKNGRCTTPLRLSKARLHDFCEQHPEKVNIVECSPEVREWLGNGRGEHTCDPARAHLTYLRSCLQCGRKISGNGFYTHLRACIGQVQFSISNV